MLKSDIKRAEALIEREGTRKDADRLIIAVKASAKAAKLHKNDLKEALIREDYEETAREVERGDMVVGFLVKASSLTNDYYLFEGDLVGLQVDAKGNVYSYYYSGEVATIRPEDITLRGASCMDDNNVFHQDIMACARALVYGSGRGRNDPYFEPRTGRRYNPRRR